MTHTHSDDVDLIGAPVPHPANPVEAALVGLRLVRDELDGGGPPRPEDLTRVARELAGLGDELAAQLAEIDAAGAARRQERALVRRLTTGLPVPVLTTDPQGAVLEANPAAEALLAVAAPELRRKPLFALVDPPARRAARLLLRDAVATDDVVEGSIAITPRQGAGVACRVSLCRLGPAVDGAEQVRWLLVPHLAGPAGPPDRYLATLAELCRISSADADLRTVLGRVCQLAAEGLPGIDGVSVSLGDPAAPDVLAASSALAQGGDGMQALAAEGPVFDAYRLRRPVTATVPFDDDRWPALRRVPARARDLSAWLACPLVLDGTAVGVLSLYSRTPLPDPDRLLTQVQPFTAATLTLIRDRRAMEELALTRDQLHSALASRAVIDQAKGMIMMTRGCTAEEAFALLVQMSNVSNRKVRDLAQQFVEETRGRARSGT